ncbi:MAG: hypothetical protein ACRD1T_02905 [Acidimicrobiia bacterium]
MASLEDDVLSLIHSLVAEIGSDRATITTEEGTGFAKLVRLDPVNPRAAKMLIGVDDLAGIHLYFGQDLIWEGDECADPQQTAPCLQFLETVCRAVMNGDFEEVAWFVRDKTGRESVAATRGIVRQNDREMKFRNGLPWLRLPFVRAIKREFKYEPYA